MPTIPELVAKAGFDPNEPRNPHTGRWIRRGGGVGSALGGVASALPGTPANPVDCGTDIEKAALLLSLDQHVRLESPSAVSTLLDKLKEEVDRAQAAGSSAPNIDLCKVSVPKTNLFCVKSKGVPRVEMPQLGGVPVKGSKADLELEKDGQGEVNLTHLFLESLKKDGHRVKAKRVRSDHLKATQNQLNGATIAHLKDLLDAGKTFHSDPPLVTSSDSYIVDGHHRWASKVAFDLEDNVPGDVLIDTLQVDIPITELLFKAREFAAIWGLPQRGHGEHNHPVEKAGYNPREPRNPHTGEWIRGLAGVASALPGAPDEVPFEHGIAAPGDTVVDGTGKRWLVHGTSRYAGGSQTGSRTPGLSVRPEEGGRARVLAEYNFRSVIRSSPHRSKGTASALPSAERAKWSKGEHDAYTLDGSTYGVASGPKNSKRYGEEYHGQTNWEIQGKEWAVVRNYNPKTGDGENLDWYDTKAEAQRVAEGLAREEGHTLKPARPTKSKAYAERGDSIVTAPGFLPGGDQAIGVVLRVKRKKGGNWYGVRYLDGTRDWLGKDDFNVMPKPKGTASALPEKLSDMQFKALRDINDDQGPAGSWNNATRKALERRGLLRTSRSLSDLGKKVLAAENERRAEEKRRRDAEIAAGLAKLQEGRKGTASALPKATTYRVKTNSGREVTRRSENVYVAASEKPDGTVKFHGSRDAARRAAGRFGHIHDLGDQAPAAPEPEGKTFVGIDKDGNPHEIQGTDIMDANHKFKAQFGHIAAKLSSKEYWEKHHGGTASALPKAVVKDNPEAVVRSVDGGYHIKRDGTVWSVQGFTRGRPYGMADHPTGTVYRSGNKWRNDLHPGKEYPTQQAAAEDLRRMTGTYHRAEVDPVPKGTASALPKGYSVKAGDGWFNEDGEWTPRKVNGTDTLQDPRGPGDARVAYKDGEPVASVTWIKTGGEYKIGTAYTHPLHRRKGLFNALTEGLRTSGKRVDAVRWHNGMLRQKVRSWPGNR